MRRKRVIEESIATLGIGGGANLASFITTGLSISAPVPEGHAGRLVRIGGRKLGIKQKINDCLRASRDDVVEGDFATYLVNPSSAESIRGFLKLYGNKGEQEEKVISAYHSFTDTVIVSNWFTVHSALFLDIARLVADNEEELDDGHDYLLDNTVHFYMGVSKNRDEPDRFKFGMDYAAAVDELGDTDNAKAMRNIRKVMDALTLLGFSRKSQADVETSLGELETSLGESFKEHRGRPGKRGGSLPKDSSGFTEVFKKAGFNKQVISKLDIPVAHLELMMAATPPVTISHPDFSFEDNKSIGGNFNQDTNHITVSQKVSFKDFYTGGWKEPVVLPPDSVVSITRHEIGHAVHLLGVLSPADMAKFGDIAQDFMRVIDRRIAKGDEGFNSRTWGYVYEGFYNNSEHDAEYRIKRVVAESFATAYELYKADPQSLEKDSKPLYRFMRDKVFGGQK